MPPKSAKLKREEDVSNQTPTGAGVLGVGSVSLAKLPPQALEGPVQVRVVDCCNDFVAILQTQVQSTIELVSTDSQYKNEGLVVGVGPGVADGNGGRLKPGVEIGESVVFGERNVIQRIESTSPPYHGQVVVIVSEKNIICKLPADIEWVEYEGG